MTPEQLNDTQKEQYKTVASELRCLVCQNQSIADSHAGLALDLKGVIAEQIVAGKTNTEIKQYMQDRYGEFILYKPDYSMANWPLWGLPFVVLLLAVAMARRYIKQQSQLRARNVASGVNRIDAERAAAKTNKPEDWAEQLYQEQHNK